MRTAKAVAAAVCGFVAPAAGLLIVHDGHMTGADWIVAGATCIVAYTGTYAAPANRGSGAPGGNGGTTQFGK